MADIEPPPCPPPLLPPESLHHLCTHGYLGLNLPQHLESQYDHLLATADAFFALPAETKKLYRPGTGLGPEHRGPPSSATSTERGYTHIDGEKEYLTLRKSLTHLPPGIYDAAAPLWHDTAHLLYRILSDIGVYLGLEPTAWDSVVADSLEPSDGVYEEEDIRRPEIKEGDQGTLKDNVKDNEHSKTSCKRRRTHPRDDPSTLLRLFRYEPGGGGAEQHRDLGLLTLCVCWGKGLQVRPRRPPQPVAGSGESLPPVPWLDAPRVTVMTGDALHVLSSYRIPSAQHRVVVDAKDAAHAAAPDTDTANEPRGSDSVPTESRRSIVFALRPTTVGDIDLAAFGGSGSIEARELFYNIRRLRVNINANKETRAAMRAEYDKSRANGRQRDADAEPSPEKEESKDYEDTMVGELVGVA
ncbi:hypothetical protein SEPCBS119000_005527 [Sporothrix epigloea]|uniref:Fe2OG dioxygenase domain-containing protein n=1 Tax=Sporothrix epigloea TaxID=1892477 RepID=A0ABP0DY28_9PEZI